MQHKIKEVQGYQVVYDDSDKNFKLLNAEGDMVAFSAAQESVERKVEELKKLGFNFPIRAIYNHTLGRVTSLNVSDRSVRFVPDEPDDKKWGYRSKYKVDLSHSGLFEETEENKVICQNIQAQEDNVRMIRENIKSLEGELKDPFNHEYFHVDPHSRYY